MVFMIVIGAFIFGQFLAITRLPTTLVDVGSPDCRFRQSSIIIGIVIFYLILGLFIDMVAAMFITLPIMLPAVTQLGYDPIWFGVLVVFLCRNRACNAAVRARAFHHQWRHQGSKFSEVAAACCHLSWRI